MSKLIKKKLQILKKLNNDKGRFESVKEVKKFFCESLDDIDGLATKEAIETISKNEGWEDSDKFYKDRMLKKNNRGDFRTKIFTR